MQRGSIYSSDLLEMNVLLQAAHSQFWLLLQIIHITQISINKYSSLTQNYDYLFSKQLNFIDPP
jgi:hypothetical protein